MQKRAASQPAGGAKRDGPATRKLAAEAAGKSSRLLTDAADEQCIRIPSNQIDAVGVLRTLKASRGCEDLVDETGKPGREVVEQTNVRCPREEGFVPGSQIRLNILKIVE